LPFDDICNIGEVVILSISMIFRKMKSPGQPHCLPGLENSNPAAIVKHGEFARNSAG
jgi:hypothetical protein